MAVSYKKLWKLLIDKDMKKKDLCVAAGISHASMAKLGKAAEPLAAVFNNTLAVGMDKIAEKLETVDFEKVATAMEKVGTYGGAAFDLIWETLSPCGRWMQPLSASSARQTTASTSASTVTTM